MNKAGRYILCGDYPHSGGWGGYSESYESKDVAKRAAVYWLKHGYDAHIYDTLTGESVELRLRYDGLGIS